MLNVHIGMKWTITVNDKGNMVTWGFSVLESSLSSHALSNCNIRLLLGIVCIVLN